MYSGGPHHGQPDSVLHSDEHWNVCLGVCNKVDGLRLMPYSRITLPMNGYTDSLPYRGSVQGFTQNCLNVFPYDTFDNRRRIGTRPAFVQIADAGGVSNSGIQGCVAVECFVNKGAGAQLIRRFVYCVGGAFFATDLSGNPIPCKQVPRQTHADAR